MKLIEMDLWDLHDDPTQVDGHEHRLMVPSIAFEALRRGDLNKRDTKIAEKAISTDAAYAFPYASSIIKKRFPLGEKAISKSGIYSSHYAFTVIEDRFPKGEAAIAKSGVDIIRYIKELTKYERVNTAAEKYIAQIPKHAVWYAKNVIKGEWKLGEKAISLNARYSYLYVTSIVNGRWKPGEKVIHGSIFDAQYTRFVRNKLFGEDL